MLSAMTAPEPLPPRARPRTGRLALLWVAVIVLLGAFVAVTVLSMRPRPTGIASLQLLVVAEDGPGVGYAVDMESLRDGYPVVVHVDEDGFPSLLFPTGDVALLPAGHRVRLPDPLGSAAWWSPALTTETVLTVLAERPPVDVDRLVELVERAAARADDADDALRNVESVLRRRLGEPVVRTLEPTERG